MTRHPEHHLQRTIVRDIVPLLHNDVLFTAINPLPGKDAASGAQAKQLGLVAGLLDLLFVHRGFSLWIELKAPGGSLSQAQKEMHRRISQAYAWNGDVVTHTGMSVVCKSLDEVRSALNSRRMTREIAA